MKRKIYVPLAVIAAVIASITSVSIAKAQPESTVNIEFEEGDANVGPLDPDEPENPGNGGTEESGSLALNYVSHFYFDKQEISTNSAEYPTTTQRPYIQVTDARGTGEGWSVSARASKFISAQGKESLLGSTLTLKDASCIAPPAMPVELLPPQPKDPVTLKFNGADLVKIVSAIEDTGIGTWLTRWYTDGEAEENYSAILAVPGSSGMKGENIAKITWILSAGPA